MFASKYATLVLAIIALALLIESAPVTQQHNKRKVVYRRFQRRRPSEYPNDVFVDEIMEVFHLKKRPPLYRLSDDDIDRIIRCDFNPALNECKLLHPVMPDFPLPTTMRTPVQRKTTVRWPDFPSSSTTRSPVPWPDFGASPVETTTNAAATTTTTKTTTTTDWPLRWPLWSSGTATTTTVPTTTDLPFLPDLTTTPTLTTTEENLPFLPEISVEATEPEENVGDVEDNNDYYTNLDEADNNNDNENDEDTENDDDYENENEQDYDKDNDAAPEYDYNNE